MFRVILAERMKSMKSKENNNFSVKTRENK